MIELLENWTKCEYNSNLVCTTILNLAQASDPQTNGISRASAASQSTAGSRSPVEWARTHHKE